MATKKKGSIPWWKAKADKEFSKFIRGRDTDSHTGWGFCCTCSTPTHYKGGDAGHFQPRQHLTTRYDEKNVHLQCKKCNNKDWNQGEQYKHGKFIDKKYGEGTADELYRLSRERKQFKEYQIIEIFEKYKAKVKELEVGV